MSSSTECECTLEGGVLIGERRDARLCGELCVEEQEDRLSMASHLRLHLVAPPPILLQQHRSVSLPPKPPLLNSPARASFALRRPRLLSSALLQASVGGAEEEESDGEGAGGLVGEDSVVFWLSDQRVMSLAYFSGITAVVLYGLNVLRINPTTGFGTSFLNAPISDSHETSLNSGDGKLTRETNKFSFMFKVDAAAGNHPVPRPKTCQHVHV